MRSLVKKSIAAGLLLLTCSLSVVAQDASYKNKNALPEIGVVASNALSLDKEEILGDVMMRQIRGQAPLIMDPVLDEYLQDLGNRLVIHADNAKFPFRFFWVNNGAINAFAFFGGHIGVHSGLIHNAKTESELASVLAHEVAHVTQRHLARKMQAQQRSAPLALASMVGGLLLALASPEAGMAALASSQAASAQMAIDYTRSNEEEADRIGITMLARAGFDPNAAAGFFSTLNEQYRLVSRPPARLLSHPLTESRIADARARAANYERVNLPKKLAFHLARARVMARYTFDEKFSLEYFQAAVEKNDFPMAEAARYGLALAYLRNNKPQLARPIIESLLDEHEENLFYLDAATDISLAEEKYEEATQRLAPHLSRTPRNQVLALNQANALIEGGQYQQAILILKDFLMVNEEYEVAYQLLTEAYKRSRDRKDMHQSKAEVYALNGAYQRAIDELQFAYNFTGESHLEKQKIRARIKQLRDDEERLKRL